MALLLKAVFSLLEIEWWGAPVSSTGLGVPKTQHFTRSPVFEAGAACVGQYCARGR